MMEGDRIELIFCTDDLTILKPGERGTVEFVDGIGTIHVRWDSGSRLGLIPGVDSWRRLTQQED